MTDAVVVYYGCQFYGSATTYLVLIILEKVLKISYIIHTQLYCTIYHCIAIQKWQYIDTLKLCIVTPLVGSHMQLQN